MHMTLPLTDERKQALLGPLGLRHSADGVRLEARPDQLDALLRAARVHCLSKTELYFLQRPAELLRPVNVRNEAAAISLLLQRLPAGPDAGGADMAELRRRLVAHSEALWPEFASGDASLCGQEPPPAAYPGDAGGPAAAFESWAADSGIGAGIRLASFGGLRGCAAAQDLAPGDRVLSIPREALIYEDTVRDTDLGQMLMAIPGVSVDNVLIIFTMLDRHDPDSKWAPLWRSLPEAYYTGLSFPPHLVAALAGTAAALEIERAQAHLRAQYAATRPLFDMLLAAYPQHLQPSWFDYRAYLWAAELWYSYCFEVEVPGRAAGESVTAFVPFACHVNHSPWPHCVRYGRLDPTTQTLDYPAFRPCKAGQQVFISYGPVSNLKLICYYGFVIPNNPHDLVPLQLEPPEGELTAQQQAALDRHGLALEHSLQDGPLSKQLLACLRVIVATEEELERVLEGRVDPLQGQLTPENEEQALATLEAALLSLLDPLPRSPLLEEAESSGGVGAAGLEQPGGAERRQSSGSGRSAGGAEQRHLNENGLDDDWVASRRFCGVYVQGQARILRRALQEARRLAAEGAAR